MLSIRHIWRSAVLGLAVATAPVLFAEEGNPDGPPPRKAGGDKPADKDGPEREQRPKDLFRQLDKNGDGKISEDEVPEEHRRHFEHLLRVADKEPGDSLTEKEFLRGFQPDVRRIREMPDMGGRRRGPNGQEFNPGQMFERLDRNGDGKVSRDEIPEQMRDRLLPLFERLKKESLTREDFANIRPGNPGEFFKRLDKNSDGVLTLDEVPEPMRGRFEEALSQASKKENEGLTQAEFQRFIARNRDGERERRPAGKSGKGKSNGEGSREEQPERPVALGKNRPEGPPPVDGSDENPPQRPGGRNRDTGFDGEGPRERPRFFPPQSPMLKLLDANGDGKITKDEVARMAELFDKLDTNHDGTLDPSELMGQPPGRNGRGMDRPPQGDEGDGPDMPRPNFKNRDGKNKEGSGEKGEGRPGQRRTGDRLDMNRRGGPGGDFLRDAMDRMDSDKDGKISKEEARGPFEANFDEFDSNRDGVLDREEIKKGIQELGLGRGDPPGRRPDGEDRPGKKPAKPEGESE